MTKLSKKAYIEFVLSGKSEGVKARILRELMKHPRRLEYFTKTLGIKHQTATARLSELCDDGLVYFLPDGRFIFIENKEMQSMVASAREVKRHEKWLKVGRENGWI